MTKSLESKTKLEKIEILGHWIKALENPTKTLTAWEMQFLESITEQLEYSGSLSDKQAEILEHIYSEKTN